MSCTIMETIFLQSKQFQIDLKSISRAKRFYKTKTKFRRNRQNEIFPTLVSQKTASMIVKATFKVEEALLCIHRKQQQRESNRGGKRQKLDNERGRKGGREVGKGEDGGRGETRAREFPSSSSELSSVKQSLKNVLLLNKFVFSSS